MNETMILELKRYLRILLQWWWLILLGAVLAGTSAYLYTQQQPRFYASRTTLMVGTNIYSANPDEGQLQLSRTLAQIYSRLAGQRPVLEGVIERLDLEMTPEQLQGMVNTNVIWDAALLQVTVIDIHPERAQILTQAVAEELISQSPTGQNQLGDKNFIQNQVDTLQTRIETADEEIETLKVTLETLTSAADIAEVEARIESWEKIKGGYQSNYAQLVGSVTEESSNTLSVVEPATFSDYPISPNVRLNLIAGAAAGMLLIISAVLVLEFFNDSLEYSGTDSQAIMGIPVLGGIAKFATDDERELIFARQSLWSAEADAVRSLRTNIFLAAGNREEVRTLLVTSSAPGDGKSTTSANLAAVIASSGMKTILVDGDLRRPRVNQLFDLPNMAGLADLLKLNEAERITMLPALLHDTDVPNLRLLPAGWPPVDPTALLGSKAMHHILELLLAEAEYIIIDGTPVLISPDAAILGNLADATTLVVGTGQTTRSLLNKSIEQLRRFGQVNLVGIIFNRVNLKKNYQYYSHYHDYGRQLMEAGGTLEGMAPAELKLGFSRFIPWLAPPHNGQEYVSLTIAASHLGLSERALKRWCIDGRIPAEKKGLRWWIRREDLEQFKQQQFTSPQQTAMNHQALAPADLLEGLLGEVEPEHVGNGSKQKRSRTEHRT